MAENLQPILHKLTKNERAVLARLVTLAWPDYHVGMLPFLNRMQVVEMLGAKFLVAQPPRIVKLIYSKLKFGMAASHVRTLNDTKVYRRFGPHPERGVTIPGIPTHNLYRSPRAFERKKDAYDVRGTVTSLKRVGPNRWVIHTRIQVYREVLSWLESNCGV